VPMGRVVSKFVPADELVVPYTATSLDDAESVIHVVKMSENELRKQQVNGFYVDGAINWDIAALVGAFGLTLLLSQVLSSQGMPANPQQSTANKITPILITGMCLFFPLPAGVLLYMVVANIFQAFQTFLLNKEALPENLQKILDQQLLTKNEVITTSASTISDKRLPFEPNSKK